jgi:hypothetical protein
MKTINKLKGYWQGWNDFRGTKTDDTHNYILNIICDIRDGFRVEENLKELGDRLISDKSDSYLFHSEYSYTNIKPHSTHWLRVMIYKVDEHFIFIMNGHDAMIWCEYVGTDLMFAIERFFKYYTDGFLMMLIVNKGKPKLIKKSTAKEYYPDCYEVGEYQFRLYHEEYLETLKVSISKKQESEINLKK